MDIIWKDVKDYEGYYQVSNHGDVRSVDRLIVRSDGITLLRKARIIPQRENNDGYMVVRLSKNGARKQYAVHRLVANAFVDGYFKNAEVNHKDCNRKNNFYENLEWVSHKENIAYTIMQGRHVTQTKNMSGSGNPNYGNKTLSMVYKNNPLLALEKQSRPGEKNGRATPVRLLTPDGEAYDFPFLKLAGQALIDLGYPNLVNYVCCNDGCVNGTAGVNQ